MRLPYGDVIFPANVLVIPEVTRFPIEITWKTPYHIAVSVQIYN